MFKKKTESLRMSNPGGKSPPSPDKENLIEPKANLTNILKRNQDILEVTRSIKSSVFISGVASVLSVALMFVALSHETPPRYVAIDNDGRIIRIVPLSEPILNDAAVSAWFSNSINQTFSTDFLNYRNLLERSKPLFTSRGWDDFISIFGPEFLDSVKRYKAITYTVPTSAPVIEAKGLISGVYTWKVTQPFLMDFVSGDRRTNYRYMVTAHIERVPTTENPQGLGISRVVMNLGVPELK